MLIGSRLAMILAFQSTQEVGGAFFAGLGALVICLGIFGFWRMGRPSTTFDRLGRWLSLLAVVIAGLGFIALGWVVSHS